MEFPFFILTGKISWHDEIFLICKWINWGYSCRLKLGQSKIEEHPSGPCTDYSGRGQTSWLRHVSHNFSVAFFTFSPEVDLEGQETSVMVSEQAIFFYCFLRRWDLFALLHMCLPTLYIHTDYRIFHYSCCWSIPFFNSTSDPDKIFIVIHN